MGDLLVDSSEITLKVRTESTFGFGPVPSNVPTANIIASIPSGPAPLAVHFDATASTASGVDDPWKDLGYHFTFGDPQAETWPHSGVDKNEQVGGPLAAHVFEDPGTYIVKVRVQNSDDAFDDTSLIITVDDPDVTFSGTNTVVLSLTTNTDGAPAGAQLLTEISAWPTFESNKRYLLKADQDFNAAGLGKLGVGARNNLHVGKVGTGDKPIAGEFELQGGGLGANPTWPSNIVISELEFRGDVVADKSSTNVLFYKNTVNLEGSHPQTFSIGQAVDFYFGEAASEDKGLFFWPKHMFIVDNEVDTQGNSSYGVFISSSSSVIMGNTFEDQGQHGIRSTLGFKLFVGHNSIHGVGNQKTQMKLHSDGTDDYDDFLINTVIPSSRYYQISNNAVGNGTDENDWMIEIAPKNTEPETEEGIQDAILENNVFDNLDHSLNIAAGGRRITERGNTDESADAEGYVVGTNTKMVNVPDWNGPYFLNADQITPDAPA